MKELVDIIRVWERTPGELFALATLVRTQGSSYRRPGARMLIAPNGSTVGSLSGGCLEAEVAECAAEVLRTGTPSLMKFDTRRRFGCNGTIEIFVEAVGGSFLAGLARALRERRRCKAVTIFGGAEDELGSRILLPNDTVPKNAFLQNIEPPIRLIIFGDGPDSRPLRAMAELLGWSVFETESVVGLPPQADERTAAVIKSHNYGRDCAALRELLHLGLRYVGLLGPRMRRDQILGDLLDGGIEISAELFAPAGLDLAAETPQEIALAIVAEIQKVFAEANGESLRDRKAPIHGWNVASAPAPPLETCAASTP